MKVWRYRELGRGRAMDITSIASLATSLKTAGEIAKAMVDLGVAQSVKPELAKLNGEILTAQGFALAAQSDQFAMAGRIRDLEEELMRLKAWDAEKQRYELKDLGKGFFAYAPKEGMERGEPLHALCANCFQNGVKSILQCNGSVQVHDRSWGCPRCGTSFKSQWSDMPALVRRSRGDSPASG